MDEKVAREAFANAGTIDRHRTRPPYEQDIGLGEGVTGRLVALPTSEGEGLPLVHGWRNGEGSGEFSALDPSETGVEASRDPAGTRPLFISESGKWLASDWRFVLREGFRLIPAGATCEFPSTRVIGQKMGPRPFAGSFEEAVSALAQGVEAAVEERMKGISKVAIAFSGGLDSSILAACARKHGKTMGCTVYVAGSRDSSGARNAAEALGIELFEVEVSGAQAKAELGNLDLPFTPTRMDRSLWCIYSMASRVAAQSGADVILLGQLADELFGGYAKYRRTDLEQGPARAEAMMREDVSACGTRGFIRDESACSRWIEPLFPFSDAKVMNLGLGMPLVYKLSGRQNKAVLREAAVRLGVPRELADAPKKAAQYSSGMQKLVG